MFGINTTRDILKLLYVISRTCGEWNLRQFWNIVSGIYAKHHLQIMLLFVYTSTRKRFVIFTCRYFKLSWNTTARSQSNCRNFSCSSINKLTRKFICMAVYIVKTKITSKLIISGKITKFVKDKRGEWERQRGLATGHDLTKKTFTKSS